jgi:hypothetical protein
MGINVERVVLGGIAAGAIRLVGEGVLRTLVLGSLAEPELSRLRPALLAGATSPAGIAATVAINLLLGVALVFLYAAMRPRFGLGLGTAVRAGLTLWAVASLVNLNMGVIGVFSWGFLAVRVLATLVPGLIAACVGAWLYRETVPATRAAPHAVDAAPAPV